MTDPRIEPLIEPLRTCTGSCSDSINPHVHFHGGWRSFLNAVSDAIREPLPPAPEPTDPLDDLTERWRRAFTVVWGEMGPDGDIAKAAEIALVMARGSPIG